MVAAQAGDRVSYRLLLGEVTPWLRRYHGRRLPPALRDDAVQDSLLALHEKRHTFDPSRPFGPWLAAIARHKWLDRLRALRRSPTEPLDDTAAAIPDHGEPVVAASTLDALLARLRPAQAEAIRLVKLQGFSIDEAARRSAQSPSLVKVNIHRGLRRLELLAREDDDVG
ncbi:MAG: sigma-70 family RNA polymerase sigma factor [Gluconacetobacter diazotrophicus]|nr:sigma-70 family RNA polymerase sigma factor [Gluconacetobacter diazotrophicus]